MSYSTQREVSDGTLTILAISIEYFDRSEISVLFNGINATSGWGWVGHTDKTLSFTPAVPVGVVVTVLRTTDLAKMRHEFSLGAAFKAANVDEDFKQALHIAQEARENATITDIYQALNMHGFKINNVAPATNPADAVTFGQFSAHDEQIIAYRDKCAGYATLAANSAAAAESTKNTIVGLFGSANAIRRDSPKGSAFLPVGPTSTRSAGTELGKLRLNSELDAFEGYTSSGWRKLGWASGQMLGTAEIKAISFNSNTIAENITVTTGINSGSYGPMTIANGFAVTVEPGATWSIV